MAQIVLSHKYSQHLASPQFLGPVSAGCYVTLHLLYCHQCQRMRLIAERTRELLRHLYGCHINVKKMELFGHQVQN